MKPVEGVYQVFGAFRLADRDACSFRLCDMPPYRGTETGVNPGGVALERDHMPERAVADGRSALDRRADFYALDARVLTRLPQGENEVCLPPRSRSERRTVIRIRKCHPFRLAPKMAHLDYRQATPDLPFRVASGYRESAETIAIGDQSAPGRVMKRRRRRLSGHEVLPSRIGQVQNGDAHALIDPDGTGMPQGCLEGAGLRSPRLSELSSSRWGVISARLTHPGSAGICMVRQWMVPPALTAMRASIPMISWSGITCWYVVSAVASRSGKP
jgi:hypothetical protein